MANVAAADIKLMEQYRSQPLAYIAATDPPKTWTEPPVHGIGQADGNYGTDPDGDITDSPVGVSSPGLINYAQNIYFADVGVTTNMVLHKYWIWFKGVDYMDCTISQNAQKIVQICHYNSGNPWVETVTVLPATP